MKEPRIAIRMQPDVQADLREVAQGRGLTLSAFVREAALLHAAGMAGTELNGHLLAMRHELNAVLGLRTPEQKNSRIERVRDRLTAMIHRVHDIRRGDIAEV